MFTIALEDSGFQRRINALLQKAANPRTLLQAGARAVARDVQRHFRRKDEVANKLGGRRSHWWSKAAQATQVASVTDREATVSISQPGVGLHYQGGTVRPVEAKALTIPIHAEAHGRRAATLENILGRKLVRIRKKDSGTTFLADRVSEDTIRFMYVLKASATIPKDPNALPTEQELQRTAAQAMDAQLKSETRNGQG